VNVFIFLVFPVYSPRFMCTVVGTVTCQKVKSQSILISAVRVSIPPSGRIRHSGYITARTLRTPPPLSYDTPHARPVVMATRTRRAKVLHINDKIDALNRNAETFPVKLVFKTVGAILSLVRVGVRPASIHEYTLITQLGQDD